MIWTHLPEALGTKSYSSQEWQNLTSAQKQEVYRQRDRLATARTVASILTKTLAAGPSDDVSAITNSTAMNNQNGQNNNSAQGNAAQINADASGQSRTMLSNISQLMTRRHVGAINTTRRYCSRIVRTPSSDFVLWSHAAKEYSRQI